MNAYYPPVVYRNGHTNTIAAASLLRKAYAKHASRDFHLHSNSIILSLPDDVQLEGKLNTHEFTKPRPLVMILHGWLGCADSLYLLPIASQLYKHGFNVFRLNFRDHGGTQYLNKELFHSCRLSEVLDATRAIQEQVPHSTFHIVGFSLGGNFALRIGAQAKNKNLSIDKIISVCPVMNAANALDETKSMPKIYTQYYLQRWKKMLQIKHKLFPEDYDLATIHQQKSLTSMTEHLLLQYTEFDSVQRYLQNYSITGTCLKTLSINSHVYIAQDDPVIPAYDADNLYVTDFLNIHYTQHGGHCGYLNGMFNQTWIDEQIVKSLSS
ncbi:MAG: YheT family hydrolase [Gammaproteobacteria bacterium]